MKLNDLLKANKNDMGNDSYPHSLYNTFEKLKSLNLKEKDLDNYSSRLVKGIDDYTPRELIDFTEEEINNLSSEKDKKFLVSYTKAAWNHLADKYKMERFFSSGKIGYLQKIKNLLYDLGGKAYNKLENIPSYLSEKLGYLQDYMKEEGDDKLKGYFKDIKDKTLYSKNYLIDKLGKGYSNNS